jgi:hypothetical protein
MKTKSLLALTAAAVIGLTGSATAKAIAVKVTSGLVTQTQTVNFTSATGSIAVTDTINSVSYTATGASTEGAVISLDFGTTSHNTLNTARTVKYRLTVTDLTTLPSVADFQVLFDGVNPVSTKTLSSSVLRVYYDEHDNAFGTQHKIYDSASPSPSCGLPATYSCFETGPLPIAATPYSLTEILTVAYKAGSLNQTVTSNARFSTVPEPASLALLGSGLLLAGWMHRRRRSKTA